MQTKQGNPKVVNYENISSRVMEWAESLNQESIKKAFLKCGIGFKDEFAVQNLHAQSLLILHSYDVADFVSLYGKIKM
jgi:sensor domain CHASE-containing protein